MSESAVTMMRNAITYLKTNKEAGAAEEFMASLRLGVKDRLVNNLRKHPSLSTVAAEECVKSLIDSEFDMSERSELITTIHSKVSVEHEPASTVEDAGCTKRIRMQNCPTENYLLKQDWDRILKTTISLTGILDVITNRTINYLGLKYPNEATLVGQVALAFSAKASTMNDELQLTHDIEVDPDQAYQLLQ
eukprot:12402256-Karenia_brevis.AAC.1